METRKKYRILIASTDTQYLMWLQVVLTNLESEYDDYKFQINIISSIDELIVESKTDIDLAFVDELFVLKENNAFLHSLHHNHPSCLLVVLLSSEREQTNKLINRLTENNLQIFAGYILKDNYSLQILKTICTDIIEKMISNKK